MSAEEITAVIINSDCVTNDIGKIDAASLAGQQVQYVCRDLARSMSQWDDRGEWNALAEAPALFMIVDGVRYRQMCTVSPISFSFSS